MKQNQVLLSGNDWDTANAVFLYTWLTLWLLWLYVHTDISIVLGSFWSNLLAGQRNQMMMMEEEWRRDSGSERNEGRVEEIIWKKGEQFSVGKSMHALQVSMYVIIYYVYACMCGSSEPCQVEHLMSTPQSQYFQHNIF